MPTPIPAVNAPDCAVNKRPSSWILGSLKSPYTTSYRSSIDTIALNWLVFEKIAFLQFGDRQTDKQTDRRTDGQARCIEPLSLSLSRAAA